MFYLCTMEELMEFLIKNEGGNLDITLRMEQSKVPLEYYEKFIDGVYVTSVPDYCYPAVLDLFNKCKLVEIGNE